MMKKEIWVIYERNGAGFLLVGIMLAENHDTRP